MVVSTTHSTTLFEDINEVLVHREQKVQSVIFRRDIFQMRRMKFIVTRHRPKFKTNIYIFKPVFFLLTLTFLDCVSCSKILSNSIILRKENIINDVHVRFKQCFFIKNSFQCNCLRTTVICKALSNLMKNSCSKYSKLKMLFSE